MNETPSVHQRIVAVIGDMPALGKTQRNEQQKFMYRGHDDVMNALTPLLAKHGIHVVPDVVERIVGQRQTRSGGIMYEVNLHVRFRFYGSGGDFVEASGWGEGTDSGDKATNKAMTMAFKYVIAQVFALTTSETADADATTPEETVPAGITPAQLAEIAELVPALASLRGVTVEEANKAIGDVAAMSEKDAGALIAKLRRAKANLEGSAGEPRAAASGSGDAQGEPSGEAPSSPAEQSPFKAPTAPRGSKAAA